MKRRPKQIYISSDTDDCTYDEEFMEGTICPADTGMRLAHSYVPWQFYRQAFSPQEALDKGTLFPELYGVYKIPR